MASREHSQYGRRRSNTAQSNFRVLPILPPTPLNIGDMKVLNAWVHDIKDTHSVLLNQSWWPGTQEGDCLRVSSSNSDDQDSAFLFLVPKDDYCAKPQLQISVPRPIADVFGLRNNSEVTLTKVNKSSWSADYVEFIFQDQYLGRSDMWRFGKFLCGQCIHKDQEISFIGGIAAKIQAIYTDGKKVSSAIITSSTKAVYRSFSAKITIFIQVCRELWEFAGDGERYNEKIVHSFLPALIQKWKDAGTNHTITIVLISRVFYDESEIDYAAGPLRRDERGNCYKDFYKVITDLEVLHEWKPTLVSLKNSFWDFQRDILLTHHYHRATVDSRVGAPTQVRLVGKLSYAQDGPILEALNLGLNPTETHYVDRSLNLTGASTLLISPGTGYFRVSKELLRLTTTRMLDQGFVLDLIVLNKQPLHQSPIFSFQGLDPITKSEREGIETSRYDKDTKFDPLMMDPLWGGGNDFKNDKDKWKTFWWEPFWISTTFWDKQMDLPFRQDRYLARAKMHEIQMLGLLEHDVLSSIEVPYLKENSGGDDLPGLSKSEADKFDLDIFTLESNHNSSSVVNATTGSTPTSRHNMEKRSSHRYSTVNRIDTIEESPHQRVKQFLPEVNDTGSSTLIAPGTSPSQSSVRSGKSEQSTFSKASSSKTGPLSKISLATKLAPSWLFNPFRSNPSEPQTTQVSATTAGAVRQAENHKSSSPSSPIRMAPPKSTLVAAQQGQPVAINKKAANRSSLSRTFEEETLIPHRASFLRRSPLNTPPRDDILTNKRRSGMALPLLFPSSSSPVPALNPTRPQSAVPYPEASLAVRWQHIYPQPAYKYDIHWKSIVTPVCLPLTVEHLPTSTELDLYYDVHSYEYAIVRECNSSMFVRLPQLKGSIDEIRRAWAIILMRHMVAVRLAQGFQLVLKPQRTAVEEERANTYRRNKSFVEEELETWPSGAAEILDTMPHPVYLSMTNEVHRISFTGETIQMKRYVRRMSLPSKAPDGRALEGYKYQCLIWPKLGGGYTEMSFEFKSHVLATYGWNKLDMLIGGYESHFIESLRYWRTRFIVIPTAEKPYVTIGPSGEKLNEEEARILGIEKLAEHFTKLRWTDPTKAENQNLPPVRFLQTTLGPAMSVLDESLMEQLDQIHANSSLRKKMKSEREISQMTLSQIVKAMHEEDGVPIKYYHWHRSEYPDSFIGYDFVSWVVREFRDVSTRQEATEWGVKLQEQGLFEHCRGYHGFLDGHYFYRLRGEYSMHMTPRNWFRRYAEDSLPTPHMHSSSSVKTLARAISTPGSRKGAETPRKVLLSHTMVLDIDPHKKSDQAERVILNHDIIHNPANVFHFELQWIGTTARLIEDQLRVWSRTIERYGLKLVEAYVTQISDIREKNAFQSCYPIKILHPLPEIPDLASRLPEGTHTVNFFEYELLKKFNFILDVEAANLYPPHIEASYSYHRSKYTYSQFVHRSGVAFVQVLDDHQGFLFLTNRLMGPGRMGSAMKNKDHLPAAAAEELRVAMAEFCLDAERLQAFYDQVVTNLPLPTPMMEEPPPLSI